MTKNRLSQPQILLVNTSGFFEARSSSRNRLSYT